MASIVLPFYASRDTLPESLPTEDEIESSLEVFIDQTARKVVGVGPHFVVKYGLAVDLIEGENMLHIQQNTSVPVPRIYALYSNPNNMKQYIVMQKVAGETLACLWPTLDATQKIAIARSLHGAMDQLRTLPSPGGYCSLGNRPLQDSIFWTGDDKNTSSINGPFETEDELNAAMVRKYIFNNLPVQKADFYTRTFKKILHNHRPIFTHGDLQRKNILVRATLPPVGQPSNAETAAQDYEITILDWEVAGWYPSYWEYSRAMLGCGRWNDDWHVFLAQILEEFLLEWAWVDMMFKELWS
ncbi:kinase-like protein [Cadophora sp. DSE1049]|nr:kinase-like protein [Cadophora sp. DSE1049]